MPRNVLSLSFIGTAIAVLTVSVVTVASGQATRGTVPMDSDDIAGAVSYTHLTLPTSDLV